MTIQYDSQGLCTRCGSTGYVAAKEIAHDNWGEYYVRRYMVKPCPCHGWRPVEWADPNKACDMWAASAGGVWLGFPRSSPEATHFRPRPQPPEVE